MYTEAHTSTHIGKAEFWVLSKGEDTAQPKTMHWCTKSSFALQQRKFLQVETVCVSCNLTPQVTSLPIPPTLIFNTNPQYCHKCMFSVLPGAVVTLPSLQEHFWIVAVLVASRKSPFTIEISSSLTMKSISIFQITGKWRCCWWVFWLNSDFCEWFLLYISHILERERGFTLSPPLSQSRLPCFFSVSFVSPSIVPGIFSHLNRLTHLGYHLAMPPNTFISLLFF